MSSNELGFYKRSPAQNLPGYIYLLLRSDGLHKIGCTGNVESRLQSLRVEHKPLTVELIHYFPCTSMREAEDSLHRFFADKRVEGEWFALDEAQVQRVMRVKRMGARLHLIFLCVSAVLRSTLSRKVSTGSRFENRQTRLILYSSFICTLLLNSPVRMFSPYVSQNATIQSHGDTCTLPNLCHRLSRLLCIY